MYKRIERLDIAIQFCSIALLLLILSASAQAQTPQSPDHPGDTAGAQPESDHGLSIAAPRLRPLSDRPHIDTGILKGFVSAWQVSGDGANGREGVVLIFRMLDGSYLGEFQGYTNEHKKFTFRWNPAAIAIVHTHPNKSDPQPTEQDRRVADRYGVLNATITNSGMYVYDPATKKTTKVLDGLEWLDASAYRKGLQAWLR